MPQFPAAPAERRRRRRPLAFARAFHSRLANQTLAKRNEIAELPIRKAPFAGLALSSVLTTLFCQRRTVPFMTLPEILALSAAAAAAGMVNALAGGGTLITFPVLLIFGTPPIIANATSTVALVLGMGGSLYGYRRHLALVRPWLSKFVPVSLIGGLAGSVLLTHTTNEVFARMVPFLLLFATVLFLAQGSFRKLAGFGDGEVTPHHHPSIWGAIAFQAGVAVYGGYFGAGIGILMLASLGFIGLRDIHQMNALKTILGSLINLVAALWFIRSGLIDWPRASLMTVAAFSGYFVGSHFAQKIPQQQVRRIITGVGFTISAVMFYRQFLR